MDSSELKEFFGAGETIEGLRAYYATNGRKPTYTGRHFETLGGGGDRPDVANSVTADDVLAVQSLSMRIRPATIRLLVQGETSKALEAQLALIPIDVHLRDATDDHVGADSPAAGLYALLRKIDRVGPVTASKLLARKRPHLIPVRDSVVQGMWTWSGRDYWTAVRGELNGGLYEVLNSARREAGLTEATSILRVFDVGLWTAGVSSVGSTLEPENEVSDVESSGDETHPDLRPQSQPHASGTSAWTSS
jgi:hypothetical protein